MREQTVRAIAKIIAHAASEIVKVIDTDSPPQKAFQPPTKAAVYPVGPKAQGSLGECEIHREELTMGKFGPFCVSCWKNR